MRTIHCPHCRKTTSESDQGWDKAFATGTCPRCGRMLDATLEEQAKMIGAQPATRRRSRMIRAGSLFLGVGILVVGVAWLVIHPSWQGLLIIALGASDIAFSVFYTSTDLARSVLKGPTDLARFTQDQDRSAR